MSALIENRLILHVQSEEARLQLLSSEEEQTPLSPRYASYKGLPPEFKIQVDQITTLIRDLLKGADERIVKTRFQELFPDKGKAKTTEPTRERAGREVVIAGAATAYKATKTASKRKVSVSAGRTIYRDISLGDAPAGMPCPGGFRPEAWEETVKIETKKFPSAAFALRVRGESMTGIGINDGDILIFANAEQQEPRAGDVVAAHIDGEVTIKTLIKTNGMITLRAENPAYPNPLITSSSAVQGVMIGKL